MSVKYFENENVFKLDTNSTSYIFRIYNGGYPVHLYYGAYIPDIELTNFHFRGSFPSFNPSNEELHDWTFSPDLAPMEFAGNGAGDYRLPAVAIRNADGNCVTDFRFEGYSIINGKPEIDGIPSLYSDKEGDCQTLELKLLDKTTGAVAHLFYTVFENLPAMTRSVKIVNASDKPMSIEKVMSCCLDLPYMDMEMVRLYGKWNYERSYDAVPLGHGIQTISSRRGTSSHAYNPFACFKSKTTTEEYGEALGINIVYSGNFEISAETDMHGCTRILAGINHDDFSWNLKAGESFSAPEVVMVWSNEGLGGMSRAFHKLYNTNLTPKRFKGVERPILINSWEAAYFDFNTEKLLKFASEAKQLGFDMLVMDDGWFGHRDIDNCSLGDWYVDERKLPGGLAPLVDGVHEMGMKFGIWYEPEMVSPDSDLYRAHPDWCLQVPNRAKSIARTQYVLDMSRDDVVDNIFSQMDAVLSKHKIDYIKWDFNRNLTEVGSALLDARNQMEVFHRYVLGVYKLMKRLTDSYPEILLENCSGGGGRFDPAMLTFSPQIWCSDNTDAVDRLHIQYGTSLCYPLSTMGSHVSAHGSTPFYTRGNVALFGTFGYELDPCKMSDEEKELAKQQVLQYRKFRKVINEGDFYRLINPFADGDRCAWMCVSEDKNEALVLAAKIRRTPTSFFILKLSGLDKDKYYRDNESGLVYSGALLMNAGLNLTKLGEKYGDSILISLTSI